MYQYLSVERLDIHNFLMRLPPATVSKGKRLFQQNKVQIEHVTPQEAFVLVTDETGQQYQVHFWFQGDTLIYECPCPRPNKKEFCHHHIAAALAINNYLRKNPQMPWQRVMSEVITAPQQRATTGARARVVFSFQKGGSGWFIVPYSVAGKYFPATLSDDNDAIAHHIQNVIGDEAKIIQSRVTPKQYPSASAEDIAAVHILIALRRDYMYGSHSYSYDYDRGYYHRVDYSGAGSYVAVFPLLTQSLVFVGDSAEPFQKRLSVSEETAHLELMLQEEGEDLHVQAYLCLNDERLAIEQEHVEIVSPDPLWLLHASLLIQVNTTHHVAEAILKRPQTTIPGNEKKEFLTTYLARLATTIPVTGDMITWEEVHENPIPRLYLTEDNQTLKAQLRFGYGDYEQDYEKNPSLTSIGLRPESTDLAQITRDVETEEEYWKGVNSYGLKRAKDLGWFELRKNVSPVDFLLRQVPRLIEAGYEIYGEQELTTARVNRNRPTISFSVSSGIDWFDVQAIVNFGELEVRLKEIRRAVRKRDRYIKLADGTIGEIPQEWIDRYRHLFAVGEETDDGIRLSRGQLTLLDQLLLNADEAKIDEELSQRLDQLRNFTQITSYAIPATFQGELRPYQKAGFDWLHFLHSYEFGGCLADDMGTGKTIQTLAFLQSLRESNHTSSADLVVVPRSLLFNWNREAERFTPGLRMFTHADQNRIQEPSKFDAYDIVLTTYGVMLRDIELLRDYRFHYIILDESQAIKNPVAETSKAARLLRGEHRLVLTGTPVENSTMELWSQFAFLNPGLLGNLDHFRKEFTSPIERNQQHETAEFLRKMVYPFILRRTKDQVAPELPPRTERIIETDMDERQRVLYDKQRDYYRALLLGMIDDGGMNEARMKILEGLLRLRQICNHPRLVDPKFKGTSGKFEVLVETLETLRAEGHKALVFSQFVQMLTLVREELDTRHIPYAYLDGQTRNREAEVDRFQQTMDISFFLISLKAGGVGLNLTAASYVIHIDPWWNPAVEMQATDRTHRIGQDKPVFVYKLVARDSVEEKILQLQDRKRELVEQVIATESGGFKSLTREDVEILLS